MANMTREQFNDLFRDQINLCEDVLVDKGREYAADDDPLHNFRVAATLESTTMRKALAGMMAKHTVSIYDLCNQFDPADIDVWLEKITDHMNYLVLLRAIVEEDFSNDVPTNNVLPFPITPDQD